MRFRLTSIADTHAGSTVGLAPRTGVPHPEGANMEATPASRWLWDFYEQHLENERAASRDHDGHALVFVGDIMDGGMHHGNVQLYHPNPVVEKWLSEKVVETAVEALEPDYIFVVLGTDSHVGKGSANEESVGKALAAKHGEHVYRKGQAPGESGRGLQRPDENRYGWGVLEMNFAGIPFDIRHHGKLGQLPHTRESYQKRFAFDVWSSRAMYGVQPANQWVAIRAHRHKFADSGPVPPHKSGVRLFSLPCYQLSSDWARSKAFEEQPDIGMLGITVQDGILRDVFPQVTYPKIAEVTWTP